MLYPNSDIAVDIDWVFIGSLDRKDYYAMVSSYMPISDDAVATIIWKNGDCSYINYNLHTTSRNCNIKTLIDEYNAGLQSFNFIIGKESITLYRHTS